MEPWEISRGEQTLFIPAEAAATPLYLLLNHTLVWLLKRGARSLLSLLRGDYYLQNLLMAQETPKDYYNNKRLLRGDSGGN